MTAPPVFPLFRRRSAYSAWGESSVEIQGKQVVLFPAQAPGAPLVLLNAFEDEGTQINTAYRAAKSPDCTLAAVSGFDWDADLTPWPAPPLRKADPPFAGRADAYLAFLTGELLPAVRAELPAEPAFTVIAGYSLAGLFAVYAALRGEAFAAAVSASGSLWYPDFADFVRKTPLPAPLRAVYLSLGDAEPRTRHPLMKTVGESTEAVYETLRERGADTVFEWNPGNHFRDEALRTAKGIRWVLERLKA